MQKNVFEWGSSMIPHTEDAVQVTQHVANYFIRCGCELVYAVSAIRLESGFCYICMLHRRHCHQLNEM